MRKMTLAQKKRRLKAIKADLAKHAKKHLYVANDDADGFGIVPLPRPKMLVRPRVEADKLPGEWIKVIPMRWPEWLPAEVPDNVIAWLRCDARSSHWFAKEIIYWTWNYLCPIRASDKERQAAWSETLVRLGYTEDA